MAAVKRPLWRRLLERAGAAAVSKGTKKRLASLGRGTDTLILFEQTFGGHAIEDGWTFGVLACAELAAVGARVPVAVNEDVVAYLDEDGAGWIQDTIEDPAPRTVAADAEALVTGILLWDRHFRSAGTRRFAGACGEALGAQLSLPKIVGMKAEAWWADDGAWVIERDGETMAGAEDGARLAALVAPAKAKAAAKPAKARAAPPESVKANPDSAPKASLPSVTSPAQVALEVGPDDLDVTQFLPAAPSKVLALLTGRLAARLGGRLQSEAPDGVTIAVPPSVTVRVKIASMGKGTAVHAVVRGHLPSDAEEWFDRLDGALR